MLKKNKRLLNLTLFITFLICIILTFFMYIKFYYGIINLKTFLNHFIVCSNYLVRLSSKIVNNIITSLLTENNVKTIIISIVIIYTISKFGLKDLLFKIDSLEYGNLKIHTNTKNILETMSNQEEEKIEQLKKNGDEAKKEIELSTIKMELIQFMIDEPYIVELLGRFINKKIGSLTIPMNTFKEKTNLSTVGRVFDYDIKHNSVKILRVKENIKDIICEVYIELVNKGCICS